jgi:hypothetical protein
VPIKRRRKPSETTMAKRGFHRETERPGTDPPRGFVSLERTSGEMASTASATSEQPTRIPDGPSTHRRFAAVLNHRTFSQMSRQRTGRLLLLREQQ